MGLSTNGGPQSGWFVMESLIKMDGLGVPPVLETTISSFFFKWWLIILIHGDMDEYGTRKQLIDGLILVRPRMIESDRFFLGKGWNRQETLVWWILGAQRKTKTFLGMFGGDLPEAFKETLKANGCLQRYVFFFAGLDFRRKSAGKN